MPEEVIELDDTELLDDSEDDPTEDMEPCATVPEGEAD